MNDIHWTDFLFNITISLLGGVVKSLTSSAKRTITHFVTSAIIGGFAGLLTYMICTSFNMSWQMTSFATGVAGYMGDSILEFFSKVLPKILEGKFNIQVIQEAPKEEKETGKSKKSKKSGKSK